jgi:hypothetical protein
MHAPERRARPACVLHSASVPARMLRKHAGAVADFVTRVDDRIELVPAARCVYVFVLSRPFVRGFACVGVPEPPGGIEREAVRPVTLSTQLSEPWRELSTCYLRHAADQRLQTRIAQRRVTVIPCWSFAEELGELLAARIGVREEAPHGQYLVFRPNVLLGWI